MLASLENRRKVNWWPWARHEFGARVHASVSHLQRPCVLGGTAPDCRSGDSSARVRVDAYAYAGAARECGAGAVVGERVSRSRHHHLWGGHVGRIVFGGLVEVIRELMSSSGLVSVRMAVEDR